jgi:hypothetical protein
VFHRCSSTTKFYFESVCLLAKDGILFCSFSNRLIYLRKNLFLPTRMSLLFSLSFFPNPMFFTFILLYYLFAVKRRERLHPSLFLGRCSQIRTRADCEIYRMGDMTHHFILIYYLKNFIEIFAPKSHGAFTVGVVDLEYLVGIQGEQPRIRSERG